MENVMNWEQNTLINELSQGLELAKQLRVHLNSAASVESRELLLQKILSSYEKALMILKWSGSVGNPRSSPPPMVTGVPESSVSGDGSPRSEDFKEQQEQSDVSKKRKVLPTWTDQVRVGYENGLEGPIDDGYSWRKYGQKDILGAKYPRSYYRCTYRSTQNCWATKQVQRSDDNPTMFEIIYRGKHTCNQTHAAPPPPPAAEKQELKQNHHYRNQQQQQQQESPQNLLFNLRTSLRVNTEELDTREMMASSHFTFPYSASFGWMNNGENENYAFSPSFMSPATPETNYFSVSPCQTDRFGLVHNSHHSESDLTEIVSATTSATNSPIVDLDFSIHPVELDPNFPFDTPGFFN